MPHFYGMIAALALLCPFTVVTALPACDKETRAKLHNDFVMCRARSRVKLTDGLLSECEFLEESIEICGKLLEQCKRREQFIHKIKRNSLLVSVRALTVETGFNMTVEQCPILSQYDISQDDLNNQEGVEGKCSGAEFREAYLKYIHCKADSEAKLKKNLLASLGQDSKKADGHVCRHFENTLNSCFSVMKKCSTSAANWLETRKAFILSVEKTNKEQNLGFNLDSCNFEPKESDEQREQAVSALSEINGSS